MAAKAIFDCGVLRSLKGEHNPPHEPDPQFVLSKMFDADLRKTIAAQPTLSKKEVSSILRQSLFAIFDQENFEAENESSRVAVLFFNLFLLFGIHDITHSL